MALDIQSATATNPFHPNRSLAFMHPPSTLRVSFIRHLQGEGLKQLLSHCARTIYKYDNMGLNDNKGCIIYGRIKTSVIIRLIRGRFRKHPWEI